MTLLQAISLHSAPVCTSFVDYTTLQLTDLSQNKSANSGSTESGFQHGVVLRSMKCFGDGISNQNKSQNQKQTSYFDMLI